MCMPLGDQVVAAGLAARSVGTVREGYQRGWLVELVLQVHSYNQRFSGSFETRSKLSEQGRPMKVLSQANLTTRSGDKPQPYDQRL